MGKVLAVCISERKGTQKKNVGSAVFVEDWGLEGDAHAGKWHRQVSLLSGEKIDAFRAKGAEVEDGAFGENLVVEGIDFAKLPVGTRFRCGEVVLELTQIGKECHNGCAIFQKMGECIMPREGVFTRVLKGGKVSVGDEMTVDKAMIFDTHAHYDDEAFDEDREAVFEQIKDAGVIGILNCACSKNSLKTTNELTLKHDFIYGALGIHPSDANDYDESVKNEIINLYNSNKKIIAIGEIGLDYYWDENPDREIQKEVFRDQMKLAEELGLPVVIHDRDAHKDTLEIMKEFPNVRGTVHCFSGSVEFAKECVKLGYYIGITGVVTFKNAKKICEVVKEIPLDRLLVETDCPYMAPTPNRGKRNKSDYIEYIIEKIAEIKEISSKEVNLAVNGNFYSLINNRK